MVGRTIGKYRIVEQIGKGGMGTVYKAVDETLDRAVAVKMINADLMTPERMQRFRSEAVALARLNHPRIATIHELTRDGDDLLMVMEYVPGETCEKLVRRTGAIAVQRAVVICDQVLDALEHAHAAGIVHRDLKPANLMITASGDVKVMDFGIARVAGSEHLTTDGFMMGTPAYMSPEQVRGAEVDRRMDLYSVAVVLYRLITNHLPFRADSPMAIIQAHLMDQPTPARQFIADLPEWLEQVLERGLAKDPASRLQTATEFRQALDRGLHGTPGATSRTWIDPPSPDSPVDNRTSAATYAVLTPAGSASGSRALSTPSSAIPEAARPFPISTTPASTPMTATAPAAMTPTARLETTVTLRTPHLAAAGVLLGLLVIGVAVLAYAALRRPAAVAAGAAAGAPAAVVAPSPTAAASPSSSMAAVAPSSTPAPAAPSSAPAAVSVPAAAVSSTVVAPAKSTALAPAKPITAPSGAAPVSAPAAKPTKPVSTTAAAVIPASRDVAPEKPASNPAPSEAAEPPAAEAATESFGNIKALLPATGGKARDVDALLTLEPGKLVIRSRESGGVLKTFPYRAIAAATYTQAKRPKASEGPTVAPLPENFAGSGFFLGTSKHWLTLQSNADFLVLRLDDRNVRAIMTSLESRTGIKTERPDRAK